MILHSCFVSSHVLLISMFSWLFGGSNDKVEVPTEKVQEVMEEAHIVKDFYNRYFILIFV